MTQPSKVLREYLRCYLSLSSKDRRQGRVTAELHRATLALQELATDRTLVVTVDGYRVILYSSGVVEIEEDTHG